LSSQHAAEGSDVVAGARIAPSRLEQAVEDLRGIVRHNLNTLWRGSRPEASQT